MICKSCGKEIENGLSICSECNAQTSTRADRVKTRLALVFGILSLSIGIFSIFISLIIIVANAGETVFFNSFGIFAIALGITGMILGGKVPVNSTYYKQAKKRKLLSLFGLITGIIAIVLFIVLIVAVALNGGYTFS